MKHSTESQQQSMTRGTFNFLCDTLYEEILMHPNKKELLTIMLAQRQDDIYELGLKRFSPEPLLKRVNFNMAPECHALLKGVCALKGITVSEYAYKLLAEDFYRMVKEDIQVQQMFLAGEYPVGTAAYDLKVQLIKELNL